MLADWYGKKPSSLPYNKDWGACQKLKKKNPKRNQAPVLWAWFENLVTPQEVTILKQHINPSYTLKDNTKAPAVEMLRLNTLRGTKTTFYTTSTRSWALTYLLLYIVSTQNKHRVSDKVLTYNIFPT